MADSTVLTLSVSDALEVALAGTDHLLSPRYAPTIAAARQLAIRVDSLSDTGWTDEAGRLDNVTVPTFLRYMEALGLTVPKAAAGARPAASPEQAPRPGPAAAAGATISSLQDRAARRQAR